MYRPNIAIINKQRQRFKPVDPEIMPVEVPFRRHGQKGLMLTSIIRGVRAAAAERGAMDGGVPSQRR